MYSIDEYHFEICGWIFHDVKIYFEQLKTNIYREVHFFLKNIECFSHREGIFFEGTHSICANIMLIIMSFRLKLIIK